MCCGDGDYVLPKFSDPPEPLPTLLYAQTPAARHYRNHIRAYNTSFQMTSAGIDTHGAAAPSNLIVHGTVHHRIGSLLPLPGAQPRFAQMYLYDAAAEQQQRYAAHGHIGNTQLNANTLAELQDMLHQHNPFVQQFCATAPMVHAGNNFTLAFDNFHVDR